MAGAPHGRARQLRRRDPAAAVFLDILLEAVVHLGPRAIPWAFGGFVLAGILERLFGGHEHDRPEATRRGLPLVLLASDALHNIGDGAAVAAAFMASSRAGVIASLAVIAHEVPQEIRRDRLTSRPGAQVLRGSSPGVHGLPESASEPVDTAHDPTGIRLAPSVHMTTNAALPIHQYPIVRMHMTPSPHTIARTQSLAAARRAMLDHRVRHLPVLDGGRIVGVVSERDILLIESLPGVDPADVRVEEAMVQDVFTVAPDTPIGEVIETMIDRKVGSAIVSEGERVIGVFTTIDALQALHQLLERH